MALGWAFKRLKSTLVFPRSGYVAFPRRKSYLLTGAFICAIIGMGILLWIYRGIGESLRADVPAGPLLAIFFAAYLALSGVERKLGSTIGLAAFALLLGVATFEARSGWDGALWVLIGVGAALAVRGASLLRAFVRGIASMADTTP